MKHTNDRGFQVNKDGPGNILPSPGLTEEGCEGVIVASGLVGWHLAVRLDTMFQAVELPAGIAHLDTSLAHVDRDAFTLKEKERGAAQIWVEGCRFTLAQIEKELPKKHAWSEALVVG